VAWACLARMRLTRRTVSYLFLLVRPWSTFAGYRFPSEVIVLAVRWYLRFGLSYRDVEELLAERGIDVDHVTIHRWVQRFIPPLADGPGSPDTGSRTAGTSTRCMLRSPAGGCICIGRLTSSGRSSRDIAPWSRRDRPLARPPTRHPARVRASSLSCMDGLSASAR
jgi:hypothetical protein